MFDCLNRKKTKIFIKVFIQIYVISEIGDNYLVTNKRNQ